MRGPRAAGAHEAQRAAERQDPAQALRQGRQLRGVLAQQDGGLIVQLCSEHTEFGKRYSKAFAQQDGGLIVELCSRQPGSAKATAGDEPCGIAQP